MEVSSRKNARTTLELLWKQPRLARSHNLGHGEAHGGNKANTRKSKHASIVEAHESTRKRLEITLPKDHEDRIAGGEFNWLGHHNLVHKFISMDRAMRIPDAKAAVDKEWEKLEKLPAWQMTRVRSKNRSHSSSTKIAKNSPFYLEEWLCVGEDSTGDLEKILLRQLQRLTSQRWHVVQKTQIAPSSTNNLWKHSQHRDQWRSLMRLPGSSLDPRLLHPSGRKRRHHCLSFIHPKQLSPFLERLEVPFPIEEILSGTEDVVSSGTDRYTTWVKTDPDCYFSTTYGRHSKGHRSVPRGIRQKTRYTFSGVSLRQRA